jgi:hypothetical protein
MTEEKKQSMGKTILKEWLSPSLLAGLIVTLLVGYGKLESYIQVHTFSTPEIKALSEDFIQKNIGISGRENLEAQNQMTKKYVGLTVAIDTLYSVYGKVYESMDVYRRTNQAILNLVYNQDSLSGERLEMLKNLVKESNTQSNATQLTLNGVVDIKEILKDNSNEN